MERQLLRRKEVEVRLGKFKNGKAAGKDEVTGEMIKKGRGNRVVDWIWLYDMAFENGVVPEDWRSAMIVPLYKGKGERKKCSNYRGISLLSVVAKIYSGILVDSLWLMLGVRSLSVLRLCTSQCLYLFLCMVVRQ